MEIIEELMNASKNRGFSVAEIAMLLGKSRPTIYDWISGRNKPNIEDIEVWAAALGYRVVLDFRR